MPHHFAVWRTSARCSDGYPYLSTFSAAQDARWPSPQADLTNMAILSDPKRQARSSCAIMHGLYVHHLPGAKPEVITSRAPATECLHVFVVRVWPLDPDSCQMVLVLDPPCRVPNRLPQGLLMGGDLSLELHTQPLGCVMGCGTCSSFTGKRPKRSFQDNPRQSAFSSRFRDESCAAPSPFLDSRKAVTSTLHQHNRCERMTQGRQTVRAVAQSLRDTLADCAHPRPRPHHRFSMIEHRPRQPPVPTCVHASV